MNVDAFLDMFISWARQQPDVDAVALVGSYARGAATKDSDVDLVILSSTHLRYFADQQWLSLFGEVRTAQTEDWGNVQALRVTYETGCEIEYGFAAPSWAGVPLDPGTKQVVNAGMKILFDPKGKLDALHRAVLAQRAKAN